MENSAENRGNSVIGLSVSTFLEMHTFKSTLSLSPPHEIVQSEFL